MLLNLSVKPVFLSSILLTLLGVSCAEASFSGGAASRSDSPSSTAPGGNGKITCSAEPSTAKVGDTVAIKIDAREFRGALFQKVGPAEAFSEGGPGGSESTLSATESGVTLADGSPNWMTDVKEGTTRIEVRFAQSSALADGSCTFTATKDGQPPTKPVDPVPTPTPEPRTPGQPEPRPGEPTTDTGSTHSTNPNIPGTPCTPGQESIGSQIAFLIDNSNSNSATDCPSASKTGSFNNTDLYSCGGTTNREKAVLAAFDLLAKIAADEPSHGLAISDLAIASFPTRGDYVAGWKQESAGWIKTDAAGRGLIQKSLSFARNPIGMTPYGSALAAATELFQEAPEAAGRTRVAVLVTDGEPTDRDPSNVQAQANALRAQGVQVITLTYNATHASREAEHQTMMRRIDGSQAPGHWYASRYAKFSDYMQALIGIDGKGGLVETISSSGKATEVQNSAALKDAFLKIIKTQAISCTR